MKTHLNIPIFIPHLGCNNSCVFCNQHSITGSCGRVSRDEVYNIICEHLKYKGDREAEIAFFGGSFTGLDISDQEEYLSVAYPFLKSGQVSGIRLSTRPDYISDEILDLLEKFGVGTVELGAQSLCDDVLAASKRGHAAEDTVRASAKIRERGISLGLQMMVGLPCDTEEKSIYTAKEIVRLGACMARIYPTVVLFDTELYNMYKSGEYKPITVEEAVSTSAKALKVFNEAGIPVIRIGLQETDSLGRGVAAGAYHPALGEMVRSRLVRNEIEEYILREHPAELDIKADKRLISRIVGQRKENIKYITETYKIQVTVREAEHGICINDKKMTV